MSLLELNTLFCQWYLSLDFTSRLVVDLCFAYLLMLLIIAASKNITDKIQP